MPPSATMRNPSDVFVVDCLPRKARFSQISKSFSSLLRTDRGRACFPRVKYVGSGTVILPLRSRDKEVPSSSDVEAGSAKNSPTQMASENSFFACNLESFSKTLNLPLTLPITTLTISQYELYLQWPVVYDCLQNQNCFEMRGQCPNLLKDKLTFSQPCWTLEPTLLNVFHDCF